MCQLGEKMKKKIAVLLFVFTSMISCIFSESNQNIKKLELYADSEKTLNFPKMDSKFEYVTLFYQDIFFNLNLLNNVDRDALRKICIQIYDKLNNGYKSQIVVKDFIDNQDLIITFGQMPGSSEALLIMTNYNKANNSIITNPEDMKDSWGLLYYLKDGKLIYYKNIDKEQIPAEEKLKRNLNALETDPRPITYVVIAENYFEMNQIKKGIKYLKDNKKKAIDLSPKTTKPGNINDVILCVEEEGKVLLKLK